MALYGSQFARTRADKRLMPDQIAALNARLQYLPEMLSQQQRQEEVRQQTSFQNQQLRLQKQGLQQTKEEQAFRERQAEAGMGLSAAKAGATLSMGSQGQRTIGGTISGVGQKIGGLFGGGSTSTTGMPSAKYTGAGATGPAGTSFFGNLGNLTLGSTVGAGLTGFGIGKLVPTDNKFLKGAAGAVGSGLLNLFTGGGGGDITNLASSAIFGGLGGLL